MRRRLGLTVGFGLVVGLAVAALAIGTRRAPDPGEAVRIARPDPAGPAPTFELPDLAGRTVRLADFAGRTVFLNFWATWCAPCREELPAMETLARELGPRGLVVLAVNYQEDPGTVAEFAREYGLSVPILLDRSGEVAARYRVVGLPATFLIDRGGSLVGTALGFRDWGGAPARSYLDALLGPAS